MGNTKLIYFKPHFNDNQSIGKNLMNEYEEFRFFLFKIVLLFYHFFTIYRTIQPRYFPLINLFRTNRCNLYITTAKS